MKQTIILKCPHCDGEQVKKIGHSSGKQRYQCQNKEFGKTFYEEYTYIAKTVDNRDNIVYNENMKHITELRELALKALRNGHSRTAVREMFELGVNTLRRWELLERETGSLEDRPHEHNPWKIDREKLSENYRENPLSTNKEAALAFNCSVSGI